MGDTESRCRIKNFNFDKCKRGNQGFKRLCLQLFGYTGHGKSSFINTCKYVWDNAPYKNYANAGDTNEVRTMDRWTYPLTENITLVDNRGCAKMNSYETGEIFAQLGNGKSSFINTCKFVWEDGEYRNWAKSDSDDGGHTTERKPYQLTRNITLVDNRGCNTLEGYETGDIFAQLGNLLPLGKVNWSKGFALVDKIVKAEKEIKMSDFIVPVFVHSVKRIIPHQELNNIKNVITTSVRLTGIYPIVVLTHKTSGNLTDTEAAFRNMGAERIFSFENYTTEDHFKTRGRHEEVLKFLHEVIKDVQFRVGQPRDPVREMKERKQLVWNYIHDMDKVVQGRNIEKQKAMERALLEKKLEEERQASEEKAMRDKELWDQEVQRQREEFNRMRVVDQARFDAEVNAEMSMPDKPKKKWGIFKRRK